MRAVTQRLFLTAIFSLLPMSQLAQADIVLPAGASINLAGQIVTCGAAPQVTWLCFAQAVYGSEMYEGRGVVKTEAVAAALNACAAKAYLGICPRRETVEMSCRRANL